MVLNRYRAMADPFLRPVARRMENVSPDTLSWVAFLFAVLAGALFVLAGEHDNDLLLLALLAIILNSVLDALDGWIARYTGKASRRGDFLDHVLDRYADAFIFGGIAISAYCNTVVGLVAILGIVFTSYMGTQSQAIGLRRNYGGLMGRADRLVLLIVLVIAQWAWTAQGGVLHAVTLDLWGTPYPLSLLEGLMVIIAVLANLTAVQRGVAAWRDITRMEPAGDLEAPENPSGVTVEAVGEGPSEDGPTGETGDGEGDGAAPSTEGTGGEGSSREGL